MADEEKPDDAGVDSAITEADTEETLADQAQETVDAITKNVQERAAEIEDVLAEASVPAPLPQETLSAEPEPVPVDPPVINEPALDLGFEENEPNLQISVGGEKVRISTAHPLIEDIAEQLNKSRQFTLYSIGGLCSALLASALFYVLMAAQLSTKVAEIDNMLGAMAKRTLQMTKGIEAFSAIEVRLEEGIANQFVQRDMLAANEQAMVTLRDLVDEVSPQITGHTSESVGESEQTLLTELKTLQQENTALRQELDRIGRALEAQTAEIAALGAVRRELSTIRSTVQEVEETVGDLYIIERARVAKQMLSPREELILQQN